MSENSQQEQNLVLPEILPVCPVRGSVLYPGMVQHIDAGRALSINAIETAMQDEKVILIVSQKDKDIDDPSGEDLYTVGTACNILRMRKNPDGTVQMLVSAFERVKVKEYKKELFITAAIKPLGVKVGDVLELEALGRELSNKFNETLNGGKYLAPETVQTIQAIDDPGILADHIAFHMDFKLTDKQAILEAKTLTARVRKALVMLDGETELMAVQKRIQQQVKEEIDKNQRDYYLREQIKVIQKELHGETGEEDEATQFRNKIEALGLPEEASKEVSRELNRFERMHPDSADASVIRNYLNWIVDLPWNVRSEDMLDIAKADKILSDDHYGLEKVKDRVLEFLAVRQLRKKRAEKGEIPKYEVNKGPILVFTGPPGVGKTSIAQSIAKALGRKYVRIALGGVRDESDIRGHRRTYIGSMPGRLIQGLRNAGTKNPVILLDEVDKLGSSHQGDPASALLEVLDPAQNKFFTDHYLGVAFDLSEVMFIATANYPEQIPAALYDRMEVIEFNSYIEQEKLEIAKRYLVPRQVNENGLKPVHVQLTDASLEKLISQYTREAGVRNLEREIGTAIRKVARRIASGEIKRARVTDKELERYLGNPRFTPENEAKEHSIGVATGMFYTPVGGDILFSETSVMAGRGGLVLTGQLGDVMKESARAALSYAKQNAKRFNIAPHKLDDSEIHIHFPAGAIPKEGPSAGITIATSLISALTDTPARKDVAMTGEITLTGRVLPIGGLKEKVLGARRAGIKHIVLPKQNERDINDIPAHLRMSMSFYPCETLDQVLDIALVGGLAALEGTTPVPLPQKSKRSKGKDRPSASA